MSQNNLKIDLLEKSFLKDKFTWLITGVAGFIGSSLMEALLRLNQKVVGLDNFSSGYQVNIDRVFQRVAMLAKDFTPS